MNEHLGDVVAYVSGEDESELAKTKAELAYALMSIEREIAIAQQSQTQNAALLEALEQCGAPFSTPPGSVAQCQTAISAEFQRRMDVAADALMRCADPVGEAREP